MIIIYFNYLFDERNEILLHIMSQHMYISYRLNACLKPPLICSYSVKTITQTAKHKNLTRTSIEWKGINKTYNKRFKEKLSNYFILKNSRKPFNTFSQSFKHQVELKLLLKTNCCKSLFKLVFNYLTCALKVNFLNITLLTMFSLLLTLKTLVVSEVLVN